MLLRIGSFSDVYSFCKYSKSDSRVYLYSEGDSSYLVTGNNIYFNIKAQAASTSLDCISDSEVLSFSLEDDNYKVLDFNTDIAIRYDSEKMTADFTDAYGTTVTYLASKDAREKLTLPVVTGDFHEVNVSNFSSALKALLTFNATSGLIKNKFYVKLTEDFLESNFEVMKCQRDFSFPEELVLSGGHAKVLLEILKGKDSLLVNGRTFKANSTEITFPQISDIDVAEINTTDRISTIEFSSSDLAGLQRVVRNLNVKEATVSFKALDGQNVNFTVSYGNTYITRSFPCINPTTAYTDYLKFKECVLHARNQLTILLLKHSIIFILPGEKIELGSY